MDAFATAAALDLIADRLRLTRPDRILVSTILSIAAGDGPTRVSHARMANLLGIHRGRVDRLPERQASRIINGVSKRVNRCLRRLVAADGALIGYVPGDRSAVDGNTVSIYDTTRLRSVVERLAGVAPEDRADILDAVFGPRRRNAVRNAGRAVVAAVMGMARCARRIAGDRVDRIAASRRATCAAVLRGVEDTVAAAAARLEAPSTAPAKTVHRQVQGGDGGLGADAGSVSVRSTVEVNGDGQVSVSRTVEEGLLPGRVEPTKDDHGLAACLTAIGRLTKRVMVTQTTSDMSTGSEVRSFRSSATVPVERVPEIVATSVRRKTNAIMGGMPMLKQIDDIPRAKEGVAIALGASIIIRTSVDRCQAWFWCPELRTEELAAVATAIDPGANVVPHGHGRIPGSVNRKWGNVVRCVHARLERVGREELFERLRIDPPEPEVVPPIAPRSIPPAAPPRYPYYRAERSTGGYRNYDIGVCRAAAGAWRHDPERLARWLAGVSPVARAAADPLSYARRIVLTVFDAPEAVPEAATDACAVSPVPA